MANQAGFRGGPFLYFGEIPDAERSAPPHDQAHLAMAYSALVVLRTLGDDLSRLNTAQIREGLGRMQRNGCTGRTALFGMDGPHGGAWR